MKISIIIPAYQAEATIERCVASILQQKINALEVLLIEDYSEDGTWDICKKLASVHPEIRLYQTEGKGVSAARNTGLKHATGDLIGFCDSDDMLEKAALEKVEEAFQSNADLDICAFGYFEAHEDNLQSEKRGICLPKTRYCDAKEFFRLILVNKALLGSVCNKVYRAKLLRNICFSDALSYCEDMHFNAQVLAAWQNCKCLILNEPLYDYIYNVNSVTNLADRLFSSDGDFRYSKALRAIGECYPNNRCVHDLLKVKEGVIAIDTLRNLHVSDQQKEQLLSLIRNAVKPFLRTVFERAVIENAKLVVKYGIIMLRR